MRKKTKVAVAISGGVDSGVAAALLVKQGYKCTGFHLKLWSENFTGVQIGNHSRCAKESAEKTAQQLKIPFQVIDLQKIFQKKVIDYFLTEYAAGRTPNPCVMGNKFI